MAGSFNPYSEWLEIPLGDQPPDHYVLLGLERFEDDPQRIGSAADERMKLIRGFQNGQRASFSQQLLNEVAAARVCLLNDHRRSEYARLLADQLKRFALPPMHKPPELVPENDMPMRAPDHIRKSIPRDPQAILSPSSSGGLRERMQRWIVPSIIGAVAVIALVVAILIQRLNG